MRRWTKWYLPKIIMIGLCWVFVPGCSENGSDAQSSSASSPASLASADTPLPAELTDGEMKFNTFCSRCHGAQGKGTDNGPPLIHKIYEPNHHGDMAFLRAAANGVRAHHWQFGNMPKIEGVKPEEVTQIVGYIRWLQQQAGIF